MTMLKRLLILLIILTLITTAAQAYYDPYTGRFLQRDPVGQGVNWYIYGMNNPMKYTDSTGMWIDTFVDVVGLGLTILEFIENPSLGNAAWVVVDTAAVFVPFVPGTKTGRIVIKWVTKSDPAKVFKNIEFKPSNFRKNLQLATEVGDDVLKNHQAHHIIPQKWREKVAELGINVDHPSLLTWVKRKPHQSFSPDYTKEWNAFFEAKPNATRDDVLEYAYEMAEKPKYKNHYYNKEHYFRPYQEQHISPSGNYREDN